MTIVNASVARRCTAAKSANAGPALKNERHTRHDERHQQGRDRDIGEPLAGIEVALVAREAPGGDGDRPAHQPGTVTRVDANRLAHECRDTAQRERQRKDGHQQQRSAEPDVQLDVRYACDQGEWRRSSLAAGQPPAGREEKQRRRVDRGVIPPGRATMAFDGHRNAQISTHSPRAWRRGRGSPHHPRHCP